MRGERVRATRICAFAAGWGRADQTTKVKGMFVRPEQIAEVAKGGTRSLGAPTLVVTREGETDAMTLAIEAAAPSAELAAAVARRFRR
jgi:phenylacetate-CoA ligase